MNICLLEIKCPHTCFLQCVQCVDGFQMVHDYCLWILYMDLIILTRKSKYWLTAMLTQRSTNG